MRHNTLRHVFREHGAAFWLVVRIADVLAVMFSGLAAFFIRFQDLELTEPYREALTLAGLLTVIVFPAFGLYKGIRGHSLTHQMRSVLAAGLTAGACMAAVAFATQTGTIYSRQWVGLWALSAFVVLIGIRVLLSWGLAMVRRSGWNDRRVAVVGAGQLGRNVARRLQQSSWTGFRVVCFFDDDSTKAGRKVRGSLVYPAVDIAARLQQLKIEEVWFALPLRAEPRMRELIAQLHHTTVNVRFVPDIYGYRLLNHAMTEIAGVPLLDLMSTPMTGINRILKVLEDYVLATLILLLASPLLLTLAVGVKLSSPGPIFFRQKRHGWDGRLIEVWKFRTMRSHREEEGQITQAKRNDGRVTRFGRFLRRTSLDELPQLFNVLRGEMSIVGPRPHAVVHNDEYSKLIDGYMRRHMVKPGITGWAQINGWRGETDTLEKMRKRVEYDMYYIENWSLWFDLRIVFLTLITGLGRRNAY